MNREQIFATVRDSLVDTLEVEPESVTWNASLFDDLGAESIDLLDFTFRIEKAFDTMIPEEEIFQGHLGLERDGMLVDGRVTAAGVERIREAMPDFDLSRFDGGVIHAADLPRMITVRTLVDFLQEFLGDAP